MKNCPSSNLQECQCHFNFFNDVLVNCTHQVFIQPSSYISESIIHCFLYWEWQMIQACGWLCVYDMFITDLISI